MRGHRRDEEGKGGDNGSNGMAGGDVMIKSMVYTGED